MPLTPEQVKLVKATVPVLKEHGTAITTTMYKHMLGENPQLFEIFSKSNMESGQQPRALAASVFAYASHINDLGALSPAVELICHKHASLYVQPEQYGVVAKYLLGAMKEVLGDALTPELQEAWAAAYWQLADIFIKREKQLYDSTDGWTNWQDFRIAKKVRESDEIVSFYLEPVDPAQKPLPKYLPGQYISIRTFVPEMNSLQPRQYSLSDAPWPDYYRISVKREQGTAPCRPGMISNLLHDTKNEGDILQVSHPFGDFFLDPSSFEDVASPVVLMSAGVGLTCLTSILNSLVANHSARPVSWIHCAKSKNVRAFAPHIKNVARSRENVHYLFFNTKPAEDEQLGVDYHFEGRAHPKMLDQEKDLFISNRKTQYFVCGPEGFMTDMDKALQELGVEKERIHMELFGTGGVLRQAS